MTVIEMLALIRQRTKVRDDDAVVRELNAAYRWAQRKVFNSGSGADLLSVFAAESAALVAVTRLYNLETSAEDFLGVKTLWCMLPGETRFTPMERKDGADPEYLAADSTTVADTTTQTRGYYTLINYNRARFAPPLPIGTILRVDYYKSAPALDPTTNNTAENSSDLPSVFHDAVVSKTCAFLFNMLDDDRHSAAEFQAREEFQDAMYGADRRGPSIPTRAFSGRSR